jgi:hypothetical protein
VNARASSGGFSVVGRALVAVVPGDGFHLELNVAFDALGPDRDGLEISQAFFGRAVDLVDPLRSARMHWVPGRIVPRVGEVGEGEDCVVEFAHRWHADVGLVASGEEAPAGGVRGAEADSESLVPVASSATSECFQMRQ